MNAMLFNCDGLFPVNGDQGIYHTRLITPFHPH